MSGPSDLTDLLQRALLETGRQEEGRQIVARALPTYAAWGRADRVMVAKLEELVASR